MVQQFKATQSLYGLVPCAIIPIGGSAPLFFEWEVHHGYIIFGLDTTWNFYCYANWRYPYESEPMNRHEKTALRYGKSTAVFSL